MKIATPLDLWRAGFEAWLTAWQMQIALGEQMVSGITAWQQAIRAPVPAKVAAPVRRSARR